MESRTEHFKQYAQLSPRETQLLKLAFHGLSNSEIATEMNIKQGSVYKLWANVYFKLGVNSARQALCAAMHLRIVHLSVITLALISGGPRSRAPTRTINRPTTQTQINRNPQKHA